MGKVRKLVGTLTLDNDFKATKYLVTMMVVLKLYPNLQTCRILTGKHKCVSTTLPPIFKSLLTIQVVSLHSKTNAIEKLYVLIMKCPQVITPLVQKLKQTMTNFK